MKEVDWNSLKKGDRVKSWLTGQMYTVTEVTEDEVELEHSHGGETKYPRIARKYFEKWLKESLEKQEPLAESPAAQKTN